MEIEIYRKKTTITAIKLVDEHPYQEEITFQFTLNNTIFTGIMHVPINSGLKVGDKLRITFDDELKEKTMLSKPFEAHNLAHRYHLHAELVHMFEKIGALQQPDHSESEEAAARCRENRGRMENDILHNIRRICFWMDFRHDLISAGYNEVDLIFMGNGEHSLNQLYRFHYDLEQLMDIMSDYNEPPQELKQELATKIIHACGYKIKEKD